MQERIESIDEALTTYQSILSHIEKTLPTAYSVPEYRVWTEHLLARYCILSNQNMKAAIDKGREIHPTYATLAPFRAWADLWTSTSKARSVGVTTQSAKYWSVPRRRVWQVYYDTLSAILQKGTSYPAVAQGQSMSENGISTDNARYQETPKLLQSIELRRVESIYEDVLLREVSFPKANEANIEVESWADQVVANWRVFLSPSWLNEDLAKGGKEAVTRSILAVCCTNSLFNRLKSFSFAETNVRYTRFSIVLLRVLFTRPGCCAICSLYILHWQS